MIETKIHAYNSRCNLLANLGIPFELFWVNPNLAFFVFYSQQHMREALDAFDSYGV